MIIGEKYKIIEKIGKGAYGEVFRVQKKETGEIIEVY